MLSDNAKKGIILVIDDDTMVRRMLCQALQKMSYNTVEAPTGRSGIQEFQKYSPDIVITDIVMPDENGFETILKIRCMKPGVKIIAMSSGGAQGKGDFLETAQELGAHATIKKPFTVADIETALVAALAG